MANVIKTVLTYELNGSTTDFHIPFEYLARKYVVVTLLGVDRHVLTLNTDYRFANRTTISTTKAWGSADGYTQIEIRRVTSATERLVDFTDGSILRAFDLNVAQIQTMHVAEEARDLTADTIGVNNDGDLDARGRRIVNVANAVNDRDVVPLGQLKVMNQNSWQARNEALQFRNEAEQFRNQAEGSKNEAAASASNTNQWRNEAQGFRNEAERFKDSASSSANSSANSASASHTSEVNAANSATASANSATIAKTHADRAEAEADKLGNWNALGGAVDAVLPNNEVRWKAPGHFLYGSRSYLPENNSLFMEWNCHGTTSSPHGEVVCNWGSGRHVLVDWDVVPRIGTYNHHILANGFNIEARNGGVISVGREGEGFTHTGNQNTQFTTIVKAGDRIPDGGWVALQTYRWYGSNMEFGIVRGASTNISRALWRIKPSSDQPTSYDISFWQNGTVDFPSSVGVGRSQHLADGNILGPAWESGGNAVSTVYERIHSARRGPQQYIDRLNNVAVYEIPNGFITGYQNHTSDGNIKYSGWYFRVPQHYSRAHQWQEFQNV